MSPLYRWTVGPMLIYMGMLIFAALVLTIVGIRTSSQAIRVAMLAPCFLFPGSVALYAGISIVRGYLPGEKNP